MDPFESVWRANLLRGVLELPRCGRCGTWNWYPLPACRACRGAGFAWSTVSSRAVLHTWTRVHRSFATEAPAVPYLVGLAELVEAPGVRLPCGVREGHGDVDPVIGSVGLLGAVGDGAQRHWCFIAEAGP